MKHHNFVLIGMLAFLGLSCTQAWPARKEIQDAEDFYAAMEARRSLVKTIYAPKSGLHFSGTINNKQISTSMPKVKVFLGSGAKLRLVVYYGESTLATFMQNGQEFIADDEKNKKGAYGNFGKLISEKYSELNLDTKDITAWQLWLPSFQKRDGETVYFAKIGDTYEVEYVNKKGEFDRAISVDAYSLYPKEMRFLKDDEVVVTIAWSKPMWLKDRDLVLPRSVEFSAPSKGLELGFTLKNPQFDKIIPQKTFDVKKRARRLRRKYDMKDINAPIAADGQKKQAPAGK